MLTGSPRAISTLNGNLLNIPECIFQFDFSRLQVVTDLQVHPVLRGLSKRFSDQMGHFSSYRPLAIDNVRYTHTGHANTARKFGLRNFRFFENQGKKFAWVNRYHAIFNSHNLFQLTKKCFKVYCVCIGSPCDSTEALLSLDSSIRSRLPFFSLTNREANRYAIQKSPEKNGVGFSDLDYKRRTPPQQRFFCVRSKPSFMSGACGASSDAPVSFCTGSLTRKSLLTLLARGGKPQNLQKGATMPKVKIGSFEGCPVRYVTLKRNIWFFTTDVLAVLDLKPIPNILNKIPGNRLAQVDVKIAGKKIRTDIISPFGIASIAPLSTVSHASRFALWAHEAGSAK